MQNVVPAVEASLTSQAATRSLADRRAVYEHEVQALVDATYVVMRQTGSIEPRVSDIVHRAGLSNQAFYRHFRSKDELLLAVLDDGQRRLVGYLEHRMAGTHDPLQQVRRWVEGVMEQARNPGAAANTRPFALHASRLADQFPDETAHSRELLVAPLRDAITAAGGDARRDADAVYHLTMGAMHDALVRSVTPSKRDVEHLVQFTLGGLSGA
ncbi:MAG TPA: TetR/AcrR family transcriptional regulator [Acidimicrobiia bacterium]